VTSRCVRCSRTGVALATTHISWVFLTDRGPEGPGGRSRYRAGFGGRLLGRVLGSDLDELFRRVADPSISDAGEALLDRLRAEFEPVTEFGVGEYVPVDATGPRDAALQTALESLSPLTVTCRTVRCWPVPCYPDPSVGAR